MIKSLQKIESTVDRTSTDTRELIAAGWNKLLSGLDREPVEDEGDPPDSSDPISEGIASEVRSELTEGNEQDTERLTRIERALGELTETIAVQLRGRQRRESKDSTAFVVETLLSLPIESRALLLALSGGPHLTRKQYRAAIQNPDLGPSIRRLRSVGLLVPLTGIGPEGEPEPCYWFPPSTVKSVRVALQLAGEIPGEVLERITAALRDTGYVSRDYRRHLGA
jgi:hypothetical protein